MTTATGAAIRQLREAAGLSREKLALAAGISAAYINKVEQGERRPTAGSLRKLADGLRMTADELRVRIAVMDVSTAPTAEEARRRLLRTAAIGGGATLLAAMPLLPAAATAVVVEASVAAIRRRQERRADPSAQNAFIIELRAHLISKIEQMTSVQLELIEPLIEQVSNFNSLKSSGPSLSCGRSGPGVTAENDNDAPNRQLPRSTAEMLSSQLDDIQRRPQTVRTRFGSDESADR